MLVGGRAGSREQNYPSGDSHRFCSVPRCPALGACAEVGPTSHVGCLWGKGFPVGSHAGSWGENRSSGTAHIQRAGRKMQSLCKSECAGQGRLCPPSTVTVHSFEFGIKLLFYSEKPLDLEQFTREFGAVHKVQLLVSCGFVLLYSSQTWCGMSVGTGALFCCSANSPAPSRSNLATTCREPARLLQP